MRVIALIGQKGGAGKTTLAINLAVAAQLAGERVLLVDVDPQASACAWADRREAAEPAVVDSQPARLARATEKAAEAGCSFVVVDTPARVEQGAVAASQAADLVLMPCTPSILAIETLKATAELVLPRAKVPPLVVLNGTPPRGNRADQAARAIEALGLALCPVQISHRVAFETATLAGLGVIETAPDSPAAREIQALWASIRRWGESDKRAKPGSRGKSVGRS